MGFALNMGLELYKTYHKQLSNTGKQIKKDIDLPNKARLFKKASFLRILVLADNFKPGNGVFPKDYQEVASARLLKKACWQFSMKMAV